MSQLYTMKIHIKQYGSNSIKTAKNLTFLIDTGTTHSLISEKALSHANLRKEVLENPLAVNNALNQSTKSPVIFEKIHGNVYFVKERKEIPDKQFFVVQAPMEYDGIIGMDILEGRTIHFKNKSVMVNKLLTALPRSDDKDQTYTSEIKVNFLESKEITDQQKEDAIVTLKARVCRVIQPLDQAYIEVNTIWKDNRQIETVFLKATENLVKMDGTVPEKHSTNRNLLRVYNNGKSAIAIEEGDILALGYKEKLSLFTQKELQVITNHLVPIEEASENDKKAHLEEIKRWKQKRERLIKTIKITSDIEKQTNDTPREYQKSLKNILEDYDEIFARHKNDSGLNASFLVDLRLKPGDNLEPLFIRPYRLDPEVAKKLEQKCDEMVEQGILEPCSSSWNSPCMGIKKKNGDVRLVNNYSSGLNQRLLMTNYPIPPLRYLNAQLSEKITKFKNKFPGENIVFSSFDLKNGFYNLGLQKSSRDLSAFIVTSKQLRYARLSMGLSLSPSVFQRFLHEIFFKEVFDSENSCLINYIDDFLLVGTAKHHEEAIRKFFKLCKNNQLILSLDKCMFYKPEVQFLGLIVNENGFRAAEAKVDALIRMNYPTTRKEGQQFTGSFNFFSRQIPKISLLMEPLSKEIAKSEFTLTDEIRNNIDKLKDMVKTGIATAHLDYSNDNNKTIVLAVDTSLTGTGFILGNGRMVDNQVEIISISHYGSKRLNSVVRLLSARSRELIGLQIALDTFEDLLPRSLSFVAIVDHKSLTYIAQSKSLGKTSNSTRSRNALATVLAYPNMKIVYCSNKEPIIQLVDGLSRCETLLTEEVDIAELNPNLELPIRSNNLDMTQISRENLIKEQKADAKLEEIRRKIGNAESKTIGKKTYFLREGILQAQVRSGATLTIVPESLARLLVETLHIQCLHSGERRLKQAIMRSNFLIPGVTKLVQTICRRCVFCQMTHFSKFPKEADANYAIRPALYPWQRIAVDLMDCSYGTSTCYILSFLDKFSRYLDIEIVRRKNADTITPALVLLISRNGAAVDADVASDRGLEFLNDSVKKAYKSLGCFGHTQTAYNSRANPAERCHKELRRILKTIETTDKNYIFKVRLAATFYNDMSQERLQGRSPREILFGTPPRRYLSFLHPEDRKLENPLPDPSDEDISEWTEFLDELHCRFGVREIERYNSAKQPATVFEIGDIVTIHDPIINLSKTKQPRASGPWIILEKFRNTLKLRHVISHATISRNGRFCRKMVLDPEVKKTLLEHERTTRENNTMIVPQILLAEQHHLQAINECINTEVPDGENQKRYNLRKRC